MCKITVGINSCILMLATKGRFLHSAACHPSAACSAQQEVTKGALTLASQKQGRSRRVNLSVQTCRQNTGARRRCSRNDANLPVTPKCKRKPSILRRRCIHAVSSKLTGISLREIPPRNLEFPAGGRHRRRNKQARLA